VAFNVFEKLFFTPLDFGGDVGCELLGVHGLQKGALVAPFCGGRLRGGGVGGVCFCEESVGVLRVGGPPRAGVHLVNLVKRAGARGELDLAHSQGDVHLLPAPEDHDLPMGRLECGAVLERVEVVVLEVLLGDLEREVALQAPVAAVPRGGGGGDCLRCRVGGAGVWGYPDVVWVGGGGDGGGHGHEAGVAEEAGPGGDGLGDRGGHGGVEVGHWVQSQWRLCCRVS